MSSRVTGVRKFHGHYRNFLLQFLHSVLVRLVAFPAVAGIGLAVLVAMAAPWQSAQATNASPHPYIVEQPDGNSIVLHIRGNPGYRWQEDIDGYTVLRVNGRILRPR